MRLSRDDFRSKLEIISFLSRDMTFSKSFFSRAFERFGAKRSSSGAFGFDDVLEVFLKTPLRCNTRVVLSLPVQIQAHTHDFRPQLTQLSVQTQNYDNNHWTGDFCSLLPLVRLVHCAICNTRVVLSLPVQIQAHTHDFRSSTDSQLSVQTQNYDNNHWTGDASEALLIRQLQPDAQHNN